MFQIQAVLRRNKTNSGSITLPNVSWS